jgi:hypothetical protein
MRRGTMFAAVLAGAALAHAPAGHDSRCPGGNGCACPPGGCANDTDISSPEDPDPLGEEAANKDVRDAYEVIARTAGVSVPDIVFAGSAVGLATTLIRTERVKTAAKEALMVRAWRGAGHTAAQS